MQGCAGWALWGGPGQMRCHPVHGTMVASGAIMAEGSTWHYEPNQKAVLVPCVMHRPTGDPLTCSKARAVKRECGPCTWLRTSVPRPYGIAHHVAGLAQNAVCILCDQASILLYR